MQLRRRWIYPQNKYEDLAKECNITQAQATILGNRGYTTKEQVDMFLNATLDDMENSANFNHAELATNLLIESINKKEQIVIYGDYDCDGAMSCAVGVKSLRRLGAKVDYYTNNRFTQGYGLVKSGIDEILNKFPETKLIITVDNGIMAFEGIKYAKEKGLTVIVTDHHEQGEILPDADAIVNPKVIGENYSFKYLCGAGVMWKLMLYLAWTMDKELDYFLNLVDIVAMATVGDIVPLIGENRIIVKEGLKLINSEERLTFKLLKEIVEVEEVNAHYTLGFQYVPMVNAIGRMNGDITPAIEMFLSEDEDEIRSIISYLKETNELRKELTKEQEEISEEILKDTEIEEVIIISHETFHEGIVGLVAGRLKERYNRPVIVLKNENGLLSGSARSIPGFHFKEALDRCSELMDKYGGHDMACGMTFKGENLELLKSKLIAIAREKLTEDDFIKKYNVDLTVTSNELTLPLVEELSILEPFGNQFPKPIILLHSFNVRNVKFMGTEENHLKLEDDNKKSLIMFFEAEKYIERGSPKKVKALGYPNINVFNNNVSVQFLVDGDSIIGM